MVLRTKPLARRWTR